MPSSKSVGVTAGVTTANDVLLYVPNLIGYSRVVFTISSLTLMLTVPTQYWLLATILYLSSFVGDLFRLVHFMLE